MPAPTSQHRALQPENRKHCRNKQTQTRWFTQPRGGALRAGPWLVLGPRASTRPRRVSPGPESTHHQAGSEGPPTAPLSFRRKLWGPGGGDLEEVPCFPGDQGLQVDVPVPPLPPAPSLNPRWGPVLPCTGSGRKTARQARGVTRFRPLAWDRVTCFSGKFQTLCSFLHLLPRPPSPGSEPT